MSLFCLFLFLILSSFVWHIPFYFRSLIILANRLTLTPLHQRNTFCADPGCAYCTDRFMNCRLSVCLFNSFFLYSNSSRKTLMYLVLTLNHMCPDFDFRYIFAEAYKGGSWVMSLSAYQAIWQPTI